MDFTPSWQIPYYFFNRVELNKHGKKMEKNVLICSAYEGNILNADKIK